MFGVVPKSIWQKTNPADSNNMCTWAMRCLLIEDGERLILIDTGMGDKQDVKFFSYYYLSGDATLISSLRQKGFSPDDVTDVFLTHLHFDHCGGGTRWNADRTKVEPVFRNARYWTNPDHWTWATEPNPRERASFLKENLMPLRESGQLQMLPIKDDSPFPQFDIEFVSGHTDKMMLPLIRYKQHNILYMADLVPSVGHLPLPYVMGYDTRPLITMEEKKLLLNRAASEEMVLFFEHDSETECCTVQHTEKGVRLKEKFKLEELG